MVVVSSSSSTGSKTNIKISFISITKALQGLPKIAIYSSASRDKVLWNLRCKSYEFIRQILERRTGRSKF